MQAAGRRWDARVANAQKRRRGGGVRRCGGAPHQSPSACWPCWSGVSAGKTKVDEAAGGRQFNFWGSSTFVKSVKWVAERVRRPPAQAGRLVGTQTPLRVRTSRGQDEGGGDGGQAAASAQAASGGHATRAGKKCWPARRLRALRLACAEHKGHVAGPQRPALTWTRRDGGGLRLLAQALPARACSMMAWLLRRTGAHRRSGSGGERGGRARLVASGVVLQGRSGCLERLSTVRRTILGSQSCLQGSLQSLCQFGKEWRRCRRRRRFHSQALRAAGCLRHGSCRAEDGSCGGGNYPAPDRRTGCLRCGCRRPPLTVPPRSRPAWGARSSGPPLAEEPHITSMRQPSSGRAPNCHCTGPAPPDKPAAVPPPPPGGRRRGGRLGALAAAALC